MNKYLILINTQGWQIEMHPWHFIDYEWFTYFGTYTANTPEEARAMAEEDFVIDYSQPTIPLQFKSFKLS